MKYYITHFKKEIPSIVGMKLLASLDRYTIISLSDESLLSYISEIKTEEITELEGTEAWKFYSSIRGFRKAYSDSEGLEPDADELEKGLRKTKIYMSDEVTESVVLLMKRIFKSRVVDEFDTRDSRVGEEEILNMIDSLTTIWDINIKKEDLLDIEMPINQAVELGLCDENNRRKENINYNYGF
jgi:hypothetical protein